MGAVVSQNVVSQNVVSQNAISSGVISPKHLESLHKPKTQKCRCQSQELELTKESEQAAKQKGIKISSWDEFVKEAKAELGSKDAT